MSTIETHRVFGTPTSLPRVEEDEPIVGSIAKLTTTSTNNGPTGLSALLGQRSAKPPMPELVACVAFEEVRTELLEVGKSTCVEVTRTEVRDPLYIELANVLPGSKIQILNRSAKPNASFSTDAIDVGTLGYFEEAPASEPANSPRHGKRGLMGAMIPTEDMVKLNLSSNGKIDIRVIDPSGRISDTISTTISTLASDLPRAQLQPRLIDQIREYESQRAHARIVNLENTATGGTRRMLETTTTTTFVHKEKRFMYPAWKASLIAKCGLQDVLVASAKDHQKPVLVTAATSLAVVAGQPTLIFDRALEPDAEVTITNPRTGTTSQGQMTGPRLEVPLPAGTQDGDVLRFSVADSPAPAEYYDETGTSAVRWNPRNYGEPVFAVVDTSASQGLSFRARLEAPDLEIPPSIKPGTAIR